MPNLASCPDRQDLQRFVLGQLPLADIERLEQHLQECGSCLAALQQFNSADNLMDAVRAQAATPAPPETDTIRELMARLQGQPPPAAPERTTAYSPMPVQAEDATLAPASPPAALSEDATQAPGSLAGAPTYADGGHYDFLAPPKRSDEIGRLGPFRILAVLGSGGMGVVFRAENLQLKRIVALKVMLPSMARTALARKRFLREAQTAAAIEHENVVTIYRVGQDRGVTFLAMQMLKGESLDERLQREGKLPIAEVLRIGRETASGLEAAHACGLIHRDIKPANLWLEVEHGRVKILDFGLARAARDGVHLTQSGLIVGTPAYMAPEQARAAGIDQRADLFSLGCVLYRCCTGRLPFNGTDTISILASLALDNPPPPHQLNAEVSLRLSKLIMLLLAKDPTTRPSSATAVVKAITTLEAGGSLGSMQAIPKAPPAAKTHPVKETDIMEVLPAAPPRRKSNASSHPQPRISSGRKRVAPTNRRRWWIAAAVLLAILAPLGYWGATTIIRLANGKGQLVIETDDPDVEVRVKRNGEQVTIVDGKTNKDITLQAGTYQLELVGGKEGLKLSTNQFTLHRDGREIVKVWLERAEITKKLEENKSEAIRLFVGHRGPVRGVAISPDGTRALSASGYPYGDRTMRLWDLKTGQQIRVFSEPGMGWVYAVAFLPDGRRALSGSHDNMLRLWNLETGKVIRRFPGGTDTIAVTRDGQRAFTVNPDHAVHLWDLESGKDVRQYIGHTSRIQSVALSPDGCRLLSGADNGSMRLWEVDTGKELKQFPGHLGCVSSVAFSPDGLLAASASTDDEMVRLWNIKTGRELQRLKGHHGRIPGVLFHIGVAFLPDGQRLLTWSHDKTLRLWDVETGKELHRFTGHQNWVWDAALTPKGDFVLSCSGGAFEGKWTTGSDFALRLWKIPDLLPNQKGGRDLGREARSPNSAQ